MTQGTVLCVKKMEQGTIFDTENRPLYQKEMDI